MCMLITFTFNDYGWRSYVIVHSVIRSVNDRVNGRRPNIWARGNPLEVIIF